MNDRKRKKKFHGIKPCCKSLSRVYAYLDPDAVCYRATLSFMQRKLASDRREPRCDKYIHINFNVCHVSLYDAAGAIVQHLLFVFETFLHFPSRVSSVTPIPIIAL